MSVTALLLAGTDLDVVNGARASFDVEHQTLTAADEGLIRRLVADGHTEPLRGVWAKFKLACSVKAARQVMTHKRYLAINERSTRYSEFSDEFVMPPLQRQVGKAMEYQYEPLLLSEHARLTGLGRDAYVAAYQVYRDMLEAGVSKEDAAYWLPMGLETSLIVSGDLVGWLRFLARRTHPHAQQETRLLAHSIEAHLTTVVPVTMAAWTAAGRVAL